MRFLLCIIPFLVGAQPVPLGPLLAVSAKQSAGGLALTNSIVSHWLLDETSGTRADVYGLNPLDDANTVLFGTGKIGNAADFESANAGGESLTSVDNDSLSMATDTPFTFSLWFNAETLAGLSHRVLISKTVSGSLTSDYQIYWLETGALMTFMVANGTTSAEVTLSLASTDLAAWHFLVAWHDPDLDKLFLQMDNGTPAEAAWSGGTQNGTGAFNIGRFVHSTGLRWDGLIDSITLWKRVLSAAERTTMWNGGAGRTP